MVYLYAIADADAAVPATGGIDGAPVSLETVQDLGAVVSVLARQPSPESQQAVLDHARVVEAVARENAAVLPARFGRSYDDAESLRPALEARAGALRESLERVRDCVEVGLRVLAPEEAVASAASSPAPAGSGRDYMRIRLAAVHHAEALADELHVPLAELARASTRSVAAPRMLLTAAYLIPRASLPAFRARVEELQRSRPGMSLACTGPWPPYSFAAAEAARP
jgi:hypothetical protein